MINKNILANNVHSINTFKQKLEDHYKEHVYFISDLGWSDKVYFKDNGKFHNYKHEMELKRTKESIGCC